MASSSSAPPLSKQWKYSVFLSFSGEDVRENFLSHLHTALSKISREIFIDNILEPAKKIAPELMKAIEESKIAVIIFSKSYASSTWCLDELKKIIETNESHGQMVIPVFYNVDSAHVHNPTTEGGVYAEAFARHEKDSLAMLKVQWWKNAMIKAANFSGWDSKVVRPDATLVAEIVKDVIKKLIQISPRNLEGSVGLDSPLEEIKELLSLESDDVRVLVIWGMGGIGKTTIIKALFDEIWYEFEASSKLENIRQRSEKPNGLMKMRKELLSGLIGEDVMISKIEHSSLVQDILSRTRTLIILDDLTESNQLESLIGQHPRFGLRSRIIVTSRDKEIVGKKGIWGHHVHFIGPYQVQRLTYSDSFKLFSQNAFEQQHPTADFEALSHSFVEYARGVPLALKVLGQHLLDKDKKGWETSLTDLEKGPHQRIQNILKLSYNNLSQDGQNMFLHIACFLNGEDIDVVKQLFKACDFSVDISYLIDKCLVTTSDNKVLMHHLLQQMGKAIELEKPQRTRLWNYRDVQNVFKRKKEWESIESISLDLSKAWGPLHLDCNAFARTPNLKFLRIYTSKRSSALKKRKVLLHEGLESFPDELLYLYWYEYPLKSLPANFDPSNLLVLKLPYSNIEKLWQVDKDPKSLMEIDLSHSHGLIEIPRLSEASNYRSIILACCDRLSKVPTSIRYLSQLTRLNMRNCRSIMNLPSIDNLNVLEELDLSGCTRVEEFPAVSMSIKYLWLDKTAIREVPLSIKHLSNLVELSLNMCPYLSNVPSSILMLKSLNRLHLCYLSKLRNFTFSEDMGCLHDEMNVPSSLAVLYLNGTNVESLPDGMKHLSGLKTLFINSCKSLQSLPQLPPSLQRIAANDCRSLKTIDSLEQFFNLESHDVLASQQLFFSNCLKLNEKYILRFLVRPLCLRIQHMAIKAKDYAPGVEPYLRVCYPGSEIPGMFIRTRDGISSVGIRLCPNWYTSHFFGFVLCAVVLPGSRYIHCECRFEDDKGDSEVIMCCSPLAPGYLSSDHVVIWYDFNLYIEMAKRRDWFSEKCSKGGKVSFEFFCLGDNPERRQVIKKCGFYSLDAGNGESSGVATQPRMTNRMKELSKYKRDELEYCLIHQREYVQLNRDYKEEKVNESGVNYCSSEE